MQDPGVTFRAVLADDPASPAGTASAVLMTVGEDEVFRLLMASAICTAGVQPDQTRLNVTGMNGILITVSDFMTPLGNEVNMGPFPPIILPGAVLRGLYTNGDAATVVTFQIAGILAPLGTVFYV